MKVNQAIDYLNNKQVAASVRFHVLTGFTQADCVKAEKNWIKALSDEQILSTLGGKEITGNGLGGFVSWMTGTGDLQSRLKSTYKAAIVSGDDQAANQEAYIKNVVDLLTKYQNDECFTSFEFDEPAELLKQEVKNTSASRLTV